MYHDLAQIQQSHEQIVIIAGEFNFIISDADSMGQIIKPRTKAAMITIIEQQSLIELLNETNPD
jgi:hypothetical protein